MAPSEAVKKIIYQLIVEAEQAIQGYAAAVKANENYTDSLKQVDTSLTNLKGPLESAKKDIEETGDKSEKSSPKVNSFSNALNGVAKAVAGAFALQKVIGFLEQAGERFLQYRQAVFTLEVGIRGLQRVGMEITLAEWNDEIESITKQFGIFSKIAVTEAVSQTVLMTRNFGFTKEQMSNVTKTAMVLSEITGKDLVESIRGITFAIASGYTEGVQRMGLNISKASLQQEALNMGYKEAWNQLDPLIRAQITYNAIVRETSAIMEDAGRIQETLPGKMMKAEAEITDATVKIGAAIAPWVVGAKQAWADFLNTMAEGIKAGEQLAVMWYATLAGVFAQVVYTVYAIGESLKGNTISWEEYKARVSEIGQTAFDAAIVEFSKAFGLIDTTLGDTESRLQESADEQERIENEMKENLLDFEQEVKDIYADANRDREDAQRDFSRKMQDLDRDYARDLEDINADFNRRAADLAERDREDRYDEEARFNNKMLELRENYLFDLDDAVRVRNARKVLDLNRQYLLDRDQERRRFDLAQAEAERRIELEKRTLARERELRLRERLIRLRQEREDAAIRLRRNLEDIDIEERYKLKKLIDGFLEEEKLTQESSDRVYEILNKYYGPGGLTLEVFNYFNNSLAEMSAQAMAAVAEAAAAVENATSAFSEAASRPYVGPPTYNTGSYKVRPFAEGGTFVARRPTLALFGEAGEEAATFTPLNRRGNDVGKVFGGSLPSSEGKVVVEIDLAPDLEGRIVDNALGTAASVFITEG